MLAAFRAKTSARHAGHTAVERGFLVVLAGNVAITRQPPCCIGQAVEFTRGLLPLRTALRRAIRSLKKAGPGLLRRPSARSSGLSHVGPGAAGARIGRMIRVDINA